jgi:hypothetical protein
MGNKNAQVTLFVLLAIVVVFIIGSFFYFRQQVSMKIPLDIQKDYDFLNNCFENMVYESVYDIGQMGGYGVAQDGSIMGISVYINNTYQFMPSLQDVEGYLSDSIEQNIEFCLNLSKIRAAGEKKANCRILEQQINVELWVPIIIQEGETSYLFKDPKSLVIPVRMGDMYKSATKLFQGRKENPNYICLTCPLNIGEEYGFFVNSLEYEPGTLIYSIAQIEEINNKTYEWVFALK